MKTIENEATTTLEAQAPATETQHAKGPRKAKPGKQAPRVAPAKAKATKKATAAKKAPKAKQAAKAPKATKPKAEGVREGSKTATVVALLERKGGATLAEVMKATGWMAHSV